MIAVITVMLTTVLVPFVCFATQNEEEVHRIAVASDRHGNEESISKAFSGMPKDVEYVSIIGDLVGGGNKTLERSLEEKAPAFNTQEIFDEIMTPGFTGVKGKDDMSILWADHDANAVDDAGILFADDGTGSGLMKTGYNEDGSVAYYIYGIAFYEMTRQEQAEAAAKEFENWIDTVEDNTIPILVFCHVPLHYARGDNYGAPAWNRALNYAATGFESVKAGETVNRDVLYLFGHNHTIETKGQSSGEFYIQSGSTMEIGAEEDNWEHIYYTYTTAGYLNSNNSATLISIGQKTIDIEKYQYDEDEGESVITSDLYDQDSYKSGVFAGRYKFVTGGMNDQPRVAARLPIEGAEVTLDNDTFTYTGEAFTPAVTVTLDGKAMKSSAYYVEYKDNIGAGTAGVSVIGKGTYKGKIEKTFTISKAANRMTVTAKKKTVKYSKVKKAKKLVAPVTVKKADGKVTYRKLSGSKKLKVNSKNGKVTVVKGTKKGTYKARIRVTAKGDADHTSLSQTKTITIKIN